jgi:hypothetical protein
MDAPKFLVFQKSEYQGDEGDRESRKFLVFLDFLVFVK